MCISAKCWRTWVKNNRLHTISESGGGEEVKGRVDWMECCKEEEEREENICSQRNTEPEKFGI